MTAVPCRLHSSGLVSDRVLNVNRVSRVSGGAGGCSVHQGTGRLGYSSSGPRCSVAGGLTVINDSLNVGKHFISASSVFIRRLQPLAGQERAVTFITTTVKAEGERPPIGLIKTAAPRHDTFYTLLLPRPQHRYKWLCPQSSSGPSLTHTPVWITASHCDHPAQPHYCPSTGHWVNFIFIMAY